MKRNYIWAILLILFTLVPAACNREESSEAQGDGQAVATQPEVAALPTAEQIPEPSSPPAEAVEQPAEGIGGGGEGLTISQQHMFIDQFNRWQIVGEVRNDSTDTLTSVELLLDIRGANDANLFTDVTSLLVANVAPGASAPFAYTINDSVVTPEAAVVTVTSSVAANITPVSLDVINTHLAIDDFGDFHCTGEIANNTGTPVDVDGLAAAVIDSSGKLATADWFWAVAQHLEPGASSPFRVSPIGPVADPSECRIYVDARQSESLIGFDVEVFGSRYYRDVFDTGHLVGEVRNNSAQTLFIQLVAGMYAADGRVLDADVTSIPLAVGPAETAAFDFTTLSATNYTRASAAAFASAKVAVDPFWTYEAFSEQTILVIDDFAASIDGGTVLVTGSVTNNQSFLAEFIVVATKFRDASGAIVAQGNTSIFEPIPSGSSASFDMRIYLPPDIDATSLSPEIVAKTDLPE